MEPTTKPEKLTLILASDDLDRAMLGFMVANGARAMGLEVSIFFALWGVNLLRRRKGRAPSKARKEGEAPPAGDAMASLMAMMMPAGPDAAGLSKMNFGGLGAAMMRRTIKKKGASSLRALMNSAIETGVRFTICSLSLDLMGLQKESILELPNLELGGVTSCLGDALESRFFLVI